MSAGDGPPTEAAQQAADVVQQATQQRRDVYDHVDAAADLFLANAGQMFPWNEAVEWVAGELGVTIRLANRVVEGLVNDTVDPVTVTRTDQGRYVGVVEYQERDFYYEYAEFHDLLGQVTTGVCVPCVQEATFDHQAVQFPEVHQHNKQARANVARPGAGSLGHSASGQERREALGQHYLGAHSDVTPAQIADELGPGATQAAVDMGVRLPNQQSATSTLNAEVAPGDVMEFYGISFDDVVANASIDTGVDQVQVGASLVSGSTIAGNTAIHGGNQGSFNVEDFGTASTTSGEVPTSDGAGNLTMSTPSGSGQWTEDGNSPLSISSSSSGSISLASSSEIVKVVVESAGNGSVDVDMRVNGDTGSNYSSRFWDGSTSSDSFVKAVLQPRTAEGSVFYCSGQWSGQWGMGKVAGGPASVGQIAIGGSNNNISSPLNSVEFLDDAANSFSLTARFYHWSP